MLRDFYNILLLSIIKMMRFYAASLSRAFQEKPHKESASNISPIPKQSPPAIKAYLPIKYFNPPLLTDSKKITVQYSNPLLETQKVIERAQEVIEKASELNENAKSVIEDSKKLIQKVKDLRRSLDEMRKEDVSEKERHNKMIAELEKKRDLLQLCANKQNHLSSFPFINRTNNAGYQNVQTKEPNKLALTYTSKSKVFSNGITAFLPFLLIKGFEKSKEKKQEVSQPEYEKNQLHK